MPARRSVRDRDGQTRRSLRATPGRSGADPPGPVSSPLDEAPAMWPPELKKGWSVEVGEGYSSPVSGDGRVFVHARRDPDEVVSAIDLATGTVAWTQKYAAPIEKNPYAKEMAKGPYSTPLHAEGRVYTLGTTAIVSAWNAATGALVWRRDFSSHIDTSKLFCGTAMSPLQSKSGLIVQVGDDRGGIARRARPCDWQGPMDDVGSRPGLCFADRSYARRPGADRHDDDAVGHRCRHARTGRCSGSFRSTTSGTRTSSRPSRPRRA